MNISLPFPRRRHAPHVIDSRPFAAWLQPQEILLDIACRDVARTLEVAAKAIARTHDLAATPILDALSRREKAGSTALGDGFAIPHARISGIARPLTLYLRTKPPIPFGAADGRPVSDVLVILVPSEGSQDDHLQLLALVAALFSDKPFRRQVHDAQNASVVASAFSAAIGRVIGARG